MSLLKGEHEYYYYWKFKHRMNMTPKDVDECDPELRNAFWIMMKYEDEKAEDDQFKAQSKAFHSTHK